MAALNVDGLISGIDTESIIKGMLEIQQSQVSRLNARSQQVQVRQAAYSSLQSQLTNLRSSGGTLARSQNSVFDARTVSVSHESSLLASANSKAAVGVYQVTIDSLAQAHQIASQGFADADAAVTQGTITIRAGDRPAATITIDASNNTLTGLADAINFANAGVSASIVQDGSDAGSPHRLLLTSQFTGSKHEISISNDLADSSGAAVKPSFDFDNPVQAAANAQVRLGSGPGALTVQSDTNQVSNLINGVTFNLLAADASKPVTVSVQQDVASAVTAVEDFVNTYNGAMEFIDSLVKYDSATGVAGVLSGERSVVEIQNEVRGVLNSVIPGLSKNANRLSTLGISFSDQGRLVVNKARLQDAISGKIQGVSSADVRRLFALDGRSDSGNVEFLLGSSRTKDSTTPYQVDITQAAERARVQGGTPLAMSTVIDGNNNSLTLNLDGAEISVTLNEGTYTAQELAQELENVINAHPDLSGRQMMVGVSESNSLTLTSASYGSSSRVTVFSGSALAAIGFSGGESDLGVDVAGSFIVNGKTETATGRGRVLSGDKDNANTADLQIRVTLSPDQVGAGIEANLTVTRGIAARLDQVIGKLTETETGRFQAIDKGLNEQIESIQASLERQQALFDRQQEDLIRQFTQLESLLGELQSTSSFLAAQLTSVSGLGASK